MSIEANVPQQQQEGSANVSSTLFSKLHARSYWTIASGQLQLTKRIRSMILADGSSWSEVIARLQAAGLNATSVQNPLTTLPEAVASAERVLARQDGPTVLVGHSFSG
jgi:hypothetical protein